MTTLICECGTTWTEGPTRDIKKEVCRHCLRATLDHLSKEAPIGDYVADLYSELSNALLIEELDQRRCLAAKALKN